MVLHKWAFGKIPYEYEDDSERQGLGLYGIGVHVKNGQLDMSFHEPLFNPMFGLCGHLQALG